MLSAALVLLSASVNVGIGLLLFSIFSVLRILPGTAQFYSPRRCGLRGWCEHRRTGTHSAAATVSGVACMYDSTHPQHVYWSCISAINAWVCVSAC